MFHNVYTTTISRLFPVKSHFGVKSFVLKMYSLPYKMQKNIKNTFSIRYVLSIFYSFFFPLVRRVHFPLYVFVNFRLHHYRSLVFVYLTDRHDYYCYVIMLVVIRCRLRRPSYALSAKYGSLERATAIRPISAHRILTCLITVFKLTTKSFIFTFVLNKQIAIFFLCVVICFFYALVVHCQ